MVNGSKLKKKEDTKLEILNKKGGAVCNDLCENMGVIRMI